MHTFLNKTLSNKIFGVEFVKFESFFFFAVVGECEAGVEQDRLRGTKAGGHLQTDSLHLFGGGTPPPVSPHAFCDGRALPAVAKKTCSGQPFQHLCLTLSRNFRGEQRSKVKGNGSVF